MTDHKNPKKPEKAKKQVGHLVNGHLQGEARIQLINRSIQIANTCAFDTVAEIVANAYETSNLFRNAFRVEKNKTEFLQFVEAYVREGPSNSIYAMQGQLLFQLYNHRFDATRDQLSCWCNIFEIFPKLFSCALSPAFETWTCCVRDCEVTEPKLFHISISILNIERFGYSRIEHDVTKYLERKNQNCKNCPYRETATVKITLSPIYLCMDVEDSFISPAQRILNSRPLNDIPINLHLQGIDFVLVGAAEHRINHYIAHCRSSTNQWTVKNDLRPDLGQPTLSSQEPRSYFF